MDASNPPTPPATPAAMVSSAKQQGEYRYQHDGKQFVLRIKGDVVAKGELDARFAPGAALNLELSSQKGVFTLHWDAQQCLIGGERQGNCSKADRQLALAALASMPTPPATPKS